VGEGNVNLVFQKVQGFAGEVNAGIWDYLADMPAYWNKSVCLSIEKI
jgi:hypothetical protein